MLISYCFTIGITVRVNKKYFKPKEFGKLSLNSSIIIQEYICLSKPYLRKLINKEFKTFYIYNEKDLLSNTTEEIVQLGYANNLFRTVTVDKNLSSWIYIEVLSHEIAHIKYCTLNDTYVQYMVFKTLFESKSQVLHAYAEYMIYTQCYLRDTVPEQDIAYYISEYLEDKGLWMNYFNI